MYFGHSGLFYGSYETSEIIRWDILEDQCNQGEEDLGEQVNSDISPSNIWPNNLAFVGDVMKESETVLGESIEEIVCPDTLHLADDGYLYITANK